MDPKEIQSFVVYYQTPRMDLKLTSLFIITIYDFREVFILRETSIEKWNISKSLPDSKIWKKDVNQCVHKAFEGEFSKNYFDITLIDLQFDKYYKFTIITH